MFLIHEVCGAIAACRNILCLPPSLDPRLMPALELALASGRVALLRPPFQGPAASIFRFVNVSHAERDHALRLELKFFEPDPISGVG